MPTVAAATLSVPGARIHGEVRAGGPLVGPCLHAVIRARAPAGRGRAVPATRGRWRGRGARRWS